MGYYVRLLTPRAEAVPPIKLKAAAEQHGAELSHDNWPYMEIMDRTGEALCVVERHSLHKDSLVAEEIEEFLDEISGGLPVSAVEWLSSFLPTVKTIYSIQILSSVTEGNGWDVVGEVQNALWQAAGGIIQADGEGFSNEDGDHILWQFSDDVSGDWTMAVRKDGAWRRFQMDLGNQAHRAAFKRGDVPEGLTSPS